MNIMASPRLVRTPDPWTSELEAMREVAETLGALDDDDARRRVLRWAADHFALQLDEPNAKKREERPDDGGDGGGGRLEESALALPTEEELYAGAPARPNDRDALEDLIVHCAAVDGDDLAITDDVLGPIATHGTPELAVEIPAEAIQAPGGPAARVDLQSLLRGLIDEFDALVKACQAETACAA